MQLSANFLILSKTRSTISWETIFAEKRSEERFVHWGNSLSNCEQIALLCLLGLYIHTTNTYIYHNVKQVSWVTNCLIVYLSRCIVSSCIIVGGVLLPGDQLLRVEQLPGRRKMINCSDNQMGTVRWSERQVRCLYCQLGAVRWSNDQMGVGRWSASQLW